MFFYLFILIEINLMIMGLKAKASSNDLDEATQMGSCSIMFK